MADKPKPQYEGEEALADPSLMTAAPHVLSPGFRAALAPGFAPLQIGGAPGKPSLRDRIRKAYMEFTSGGLNEPVALIDIRGQIKDVPREALDAELLKMHHEEGHTLSGWENPRQITPGMREGAIHYKGEPLYMLTINK